MCSLPTAKVVEHYEPEFVRRFCLHILPKGFQKIRHFGLLSNRNRKEKIAAARVLLEKTAAPSSSAAAPAGAAALLKAALLRATAPLQPCCPCCGSGQLIVVEHRERHITPVSLPFPDSS